MNVNPLDGWARGLAPRAVNVFWIRQRRSGGRRTRRGRDDLSSDPGPLDMQAAACLYLASDILHIESG